MASPMRDPPNALTTAKTTAKAGNAAATGRRPVAAALPALAVVFAVVRALGGSRIGDAIALVAGALAGTAVYVTLLFLLWRHVVVDIVKLLASGLRQRFDNRRNKMAPTQAAS